VHDAGRWPTMSSKALEMIVRCPHCRTSFKLDAHRIKGATARMRCTRCRHVFSMRHPGSPAQEDGPSPLPQEVAQPALAQDTFSGGLPEGAAREESPAPPYYETPSVPETRLADEVAARRESLPPPHEVMGHAPVPERRRRWLPVLLVAVLMTVAAMVLWFFFPWSHARQSASDNAGIHLLHLVETQGYFVESQQAGQLFVIEGRVRNDFATPRRWILLRAKLYTTDGQEARQQLFYAGNLLSTEQLRTLPLADQLGLIQQTPQGPQVAITPGQEVSFVVPFGDLPDISKLSDYSVEIVASQSS
jgi:predicted Zn finger-like uncharacterized protein